MFIVAFAAFVLGIGAGWYLKGRFGTQAAADLAKAETAARSL